MANERTLTAAEFDCYRPYFQQQTLDTVRIVEGRVPIWLRKKMCAVVLGIVFIYARSLISRAHIARYATWMRAACT